MTADLRRLWQEAFGDSEEALDSFFATGFSPDRYHCISEDGIPVSALYWFDCSLDGHRLAYLYAVATLKSHRGKGLAHRLMRETHEILKKQSYAGAVLVPGTADLSAFYEKLGYRTVTTVKEFTCSEAHKPVALEEVTATAYARLRNHLLPPGGVVQEGAALDYLQACAKLYAGEGFLLSAAAEGDCLQVQEFLGNTSLAPRILTALGMAKGNFRTPGEDREFAMFLPFQAECPIPSYFGLALD